MSMRAEPLTCTVVLQHWPRDKKPGNCLKHYQGQKILHALKDQRPLRQSLMNHVKCDIHLGSEEKKGLMSYGVDGSEFGPIGL